MNLLYMIRSITSSSKIERLCKSDIKKKDKKTYVRMIKTAQIFTLWHIKKTDNMLGNVK